MSFIDLILRWTWIIHSLKVWLIKYCKKSLSYRISRWFRSNRNIICRRSWNTCRVVYFYIALYIHCLPVFFIRISKKTPRWSVSLRSRRFNSCVVFWSWSPFWHSFPFQNSFLCSEVMSQITRHVMGIKWISKLYSCSSCQIYSKSFISCERSRNYRVS